MNKIFLFHIPNFFLFFIFIADSLLTALDIPDEMKEEYLKQKKLKEPRLDIPATTKPPAEINIITIMNH